MKHTKGKWIKGYGNGLTGPTSAREPNPTVDDERKYIPISLGRETIAIVIMQCIEDIEELESNAKLISKAPEMFEALKESVDMLKHIHSKDLGVKHLGFSENFMVKLNNFESLINEIES